MSKNKAKSKMTFVGNRRVYYAEVFLIKNCILLSGAAIFKTKKEARANIKDGIQKQYGNAKYKIKMLFQLPAEFEIEEVE